MNREEIVKQVKKATNSRYFSQPSFFKDIHFSALKFVAQRFYVSIYTSFTGQLNEATKTKVGAVAALDTDINKSKAVKLRQIFNGDIHAMYIFNNFYRKNDDGRCLNWFIFTNMGEILCRNNFGGRGQSVPLSVDNFRLNLLTELFVDAYGLGVKTLEHQYRTTEVMALIRIMRTTGDFSPMPILADALQDAGFTEEIILSHFRDPNAQFSFGSWIFRASGFNCKVKNKKQVENAEARRD